MNLKLELSQDELRIKMDSEGDEILQISPYWVGWEALNQEGIVFERGVFQLPGIIKGELFKIKLSAEAIQANLVPVRNFTPYPVSMFRVMKSAGLWRVTGEVEAVCGELQIRTRSDNDGQPQIIAQLTQHGKFSCEEEIRSPWTVAEVKHNQMGSLTVVKNIVFTDLSSGQRWGIIGECAKPEHPGLQKDDARLIFTQGSQSYSYFTCWPALL